MMEDDRFIEAINLFHNHLVAISVTLGIVGSLFVFFSFLSAVFVFRLGKYVRSATDSAISKYVNDDEFKEMVVTILKEELRTTFKESGVRGITKKAIVKKKKKGNKE